MLYVSFYHVRPDKVERLRSWMQEISRRRVEALQSYAQEGTRHELAYLAHAREGPVLISIAEVEDREKARAAFRSSTLPIDLEHRRVIHEVVSGRADIELLYECSVRDATSPRGRL